MLSNWINFKNQVLPQRNSTVKILTDIKLKLFFNNPLFFAHLTDVQKKQPSILTDAEILSNILKALPCEGTDTWVSVYEPSKTDDAVNPSKSKPNLDDFIINLDDSFEDEKQNTDKSDPLAFAVGTVAKSTDEEKSTKIFFASKDIEKVETSKDEAEEKTSITNKVVPNDENCIICIDTDDEDETKTESSSNTDVIMQPVEPSKEPNSQKLTETVISTPPTVDNKTECQIESKKRTSDELSSSEIDPLISNGPPLKIPRLPKLSECVNMECPKINDSTYEPASKFILHFYFVSTKLNKDQLVCNSCTEKAVEKFEMISGALLQGQPVCDIELPKKAELVEIIDSDEESESENNDGGNKNQ